MRLTLAISLTLICISPCLAQWTPLRGPATTIANFSAGKQHIFASTADDIFRSADQGLHWARVSDLPPGYSYDLVRISPDSTQLAVSAYDNACLCPHLFRSTDDGLSWDKMAVPGFAEYIAAVYAGADDYLLASVARQIADKPEWSVWESADGGRSWRKNPLDTLSGTHKWNIQYQEGHLWAMNDRQLFRGSADGQQWEIVAQNLDSFHLSSYQLIDNTILVHTSSYLGANLWRSTNGGQSWAKVAGAPGNLLNFQRHQNILLASSGYAIVRSDDRGLSWTTVSTDSVDTNFLLRYPDLIAWKYETGVVRSTDAGAQFAALNERLGYAGFGEKMARLGDWVYVTNARGAKEALLRFHTADNTWEIRPNTPEVIWYASDFLHDLTELDGRLFFSEWFNVVRSDDAGASWVDCSENQIPASTRASGNKMFTIGHRLFTFENLHNGDGILYRTDDYGANWVHLTSSPSSSSICTGFGISLAGPVGDKLFAGQLNGTCLFESTDFGSSWSAVQLPEIPLETDSGRAYILSMEPTGKRILLIMGRWEKEQEDYFFFVSNDEGASWQSIETPLFSSNRRDVINKQPTSVLEADSCTLLTFYGSGALLSADGGLHWTSFNEGLPSIYLTDIIADEQFLYAAVPGHGIYKRPLADLKQSGNTNGANFSAHISPNPGRGLARLQVSTPLESALLQWYDMSGRLVQEEMVRFSCNQAVVELPFPGGQYVFRLHSAGKQARGKVIVVR